MAIIGMDIGKRNSQICIADDEGKVLLERRVKTERLAIQAFFFEKYVGTRILLEAGTSTEWIATELEALGLVVIVADPSSIPLAALGTRNTKTDRRDARGLVEALQGLPPGVPPPRADRDDVTLIHARGAQVGIRTQLINSIKAFLEQDGYRPASCSSSKFVDAVDELELPDGYLARRGLDSLLATLTAVEAAIQATSTRIAQRTDEKPAATRLMQIPGVGPITALMFTAVIGDPTRFKSAKQLRAYLGLAPREYSSGEKRAVGRISKAGDKTLRSLLVQVAHLLRRSKSELVAPLAVWSREVERRRGKGRAVVALARRFAGILWALWRDEAEFDANRFAQQPAAEA
ncbi:MAG: IS110 family transposase [Deltaproteobacteria bacterium]|nr:IS110 family transposase [Deltaproteobacteria bacterium]